MLLVLGGALYFVCFLLNLLLVLKLESLCRPLDRAIRPFPSLRAYRNPRIYRGLVFWGARLTVMGAALSVILSAQGNINH